MIRGRTVYVLVPNQTGLDRFNEPIYGEPERVTVDNVLIEAGDTAGLGATREDGASIDLTLHFPKTFTGNLRGCSVELPAPWPSTVKVDGDPQPFQDENCPTPWNRPVGAVVVHG